MLIVWDNSEKTHIDDTNKDVYPGHHLRFTVELNGIPENDVESYAWTIPDDDSFSEYTITLIKGESKPVTAKAGKSVDFYFYKAGDGKSISVKVTLKDNSSYSDDKTINVKIPAIEYHDVDGNNAPVVGDVINVTDGQHALTVDANARAVGLWNAFHKGSTVVQSPGIIFAAELSAAAGFSNDSLWGFGQLFLSGTLKVNQNNGTAFKGHKATPSKFYDESKLPDARNSLNKYNIEAPFKTDGESIGSAFDSPGNDKVTKAWSLVANDSNFITYIFLKPDKSDTPVKLESAWVPIAQVKWSVSYCASRTEGTTDNFTVHPNSKATPQPWASFDGTLPTWSQGEPKVLPFKAMLITFSCP